MCGIGGHQNIKPISQKGLWCLSWYLGSMGNSRVYTAAELIIDLPYSLTITMALQPNMHVLNQAALTFTAEVAKFSNIPALAEGNAILDAIAALGKRVDNKANLLVIRLRVM